MLTPHRHALIAAQRILPGHQSLLPSTSVSTVALSTETSAYTSVLSGEYPVRRCRGATQHLSPHSSLSHHPRHSTDPSSTNLDTWSLQQLRTLKVGGNGPIAEFFTKHGGSSLLPPGNNDARTRYTSRQAGLYKEELQRRVAEDARKNPNGIHIDGLDLTPMGSSTPAAEKADDFFESWDKAAPSPRPSKPSSPAPPSIGVRSTPTPPPSAPTAPRTVSSSSLRGAARPAAKASKLGASKLGGSKLGAKKAGTAINFEEAQRKAIEDEERIKRLGYDKLKEEEEAAALKAREEEERRKNDAAGIANSRSATPMSSSRPAREEKKPVPVKLGFGQVAAAPKVQEPTKA